MHGSKADYLEGVAAREGFPFLRFDYSGHGASGGDFRKGTISRWLEEAQRLSMETPEGLRIPYDPALREAFLKAFEGPPVDLWPLFDALAGLPLALIRGANSDLLTAETVQKMLARRPDMTVATVPGRAHIPFLDEPEAVALIRTFLDRLT